MADSAIFQKNSHIKYFLRCLKTVLPSQYASNDSNRVLLAFFTVAGLDLLGALDTTTTLDDRNGYIDWLYHCQTPSGGFRGFTGTNFGAEKRTAHNECWDPANVPATFFALATLLILGDDLSRVKRKDCLLWLSRMQRDDGSFGEVLGVDGKIEGGSDTRFCCCAAGIRYILWGKHGKGLDGVEDVNTGKLISYIESCQTYDGGLSEAPFCEAHAGLSYCAIGSLSFLNRLSDDTAGSNLLSPGTREFASLVHWLVSRQTTELGEEDEVSDDADISNDVQQLEDNVEAFHPADNISSLPDLSPHIEGSFLWAGFNGRCNKLADTCYSFWTAGSLAILDRLSLMDATSNRRFLLEKTQHVIGGFGKGVGEPPDLLHSYLGLVSLALQDEPGLNKADPTLCASQRTTHHLRNLPWWRDLQLDPIIVV